MEADKDIVDDTVTRELASTADSLTALAEIIKDVLHESDQIHTLYNLVYFTLAELNRLRMSLEEGPEMIAWCARNVFELNIIVHYVLKSKENLDLWIASSLYDLRQITKDLLSFVESFPDHAEPEYLIQELNIDLSEAEKGISAITAISGAPEKKLMNMHDMAEQVGLGPRYKAFYALCSKYVHPSP